MVETETSHNLLDSDLIHPRTQIEDSVEVVRVLVAIFLCT